MRRYLEEIKKTNAKVGSKYKNATPKVSSIRSRADLEFLGITADDEEAPRRNRNAEALGMPPQPKREAKADELEDATSRREKKGIYWIKVQVDEEIRKNIVKAEEANDLWKKENTKAENRFKELHGDFQKRKQYVDREIETDTGEQLEKFEEYAKEMVEKLMKQNIVLKENNKSISKKGMQLEKIDDKLLDILIEQLEKSKVKRNFEKMTTLLGLTQSQWVAVLQFEEFYKSRKNEGLGQIEKNNDLVLAKELFACWDKKRLGHITIEEMAEELISFGLAANRDMVVKLIQTVT